MNNYVYILSALPSPEEVISLCDGKDAETVRFVLDGCNPDKIDASFYERAQKSRSRFIRTYFEFDRRLRNTKARWLGETLGMDVSKDIVSFPEDEFRPFDDEARLLDILRGKDILARERELDALMWEKAEEITRLDVFSLDLVLAYVAKMATVERWNRLSAEEGRKFLRKLVDELRNTNIWQQQEK
ncbi:MAG: DUF2764 family protein [Bacteroidales bacterium]|nr:DUF2764 family protein [Bacteroidales bacterium]